MEMSYCIWMRRVKMATTTTAAASSSVFRPTTASSISPLFTPSSSKPTPPLLSHLFHRHSSISTTATPQSSRFPISQTLDHNCSSSSGAEDGGINPKDSQKILLKGMRYKELENWVISKGYRSAQALMLWKLLYGNNSNSIWAHSFDELEGLNKDLSMMLSKYAKLKALQVKDIVIASDGTRKILFMLDDGLVIETVIIPNGDRGRNTVMGLRRNLTAAEIVEQAVFARRLFTSEVGSIRNVVFMGMGEPLQNIENVMKAADIMVDEQGLHFSPNKVTISTSGLVPQMKRFLRDIDDAKRIVDLVEGIPCKINLITFNPHSGSHFHPTTDKKMVEFRNTLAEGGCRVFMRPSRGDDQMAACGQLGNPGDFQAPLLKVPPRFQPALEPSVRSL
ncbi:hypothetical protein Ccrd_000088 [Cynara cardunculus var. scolymus]|uniref:Aldolase-type TIM barrel n=1 Tax=Cynara cardunculus var. scolymus TaxID=59895 RepID=A0A103XVV2_CYNCS|nr:hypothetical protein Ccrd_000088 [Cynara cardunculus var. scolymus]